jgi:hypothetical protein
MGLGNNFRRKHIMKIKNGELTNFVFRITVFIFLISATLFSGCMRRGVEELEKERLFSLPIGKGEEGEEYIGIMREKNGELGGPSHVLFENGFFFIVDSVNQKLLKITTPGDVILTIERGEGTKTDDENILRTKQRKYYNFNQIGNIAVDKENNIYIEDISIQKRKLKSIIDVLSKGEVVEEEGNFEEVYVSHILKFDRLGNFLFKLGVDGRDTEPFYQIYKISTTRDGNLIVLTMDEEWENWTYYKFDEDGNRLMMNVIKSKDIVASEDMKGRAYFIMDVFPSNLDDRLLYWISLYETLYDTKGVKKEVDTWEEEIELEDYEAIKKKEEQAPKTEIMRDLLYYKLIQYDVVTGEMHTTMKWQMDGGNRVEPTEELLGVDGEFNGFLWKYLDKNRSVITIVNPEGTVVERRSFFFEDDGIWMNVQVASDGSVSGIKIDDKYVHFYRWRSDRLLKEKKEGVTLKKFFRDKIEGFRNANR